MSQQVAPADHDPAIQATSPEPGKPDGTRDYCSLIAGGIKVYALPQKSLALYLVREANGWRRALIRRASPFIVKDPAGQTLYEIRNVQKRFDFLPRFAMDRQGSTIWTISTRSIFQHRHSLRQAGGEDWDFRTPFFNLQVEGQTGKSARILGAVHRIHTWFFRVPGGIDTPEMLAALAFLHYRWYSL